MIQKIDSPENVAAFRATGEITAEDYQTALVPVVVELAKKRNEINFLILIDTDIKNLKIASWMEDALLGLRNLGKWNRAAIITDSERAIRFTNSFNYFVSGEFRGFKKNDFNKALHWVEGAN
ncbi:SpoIIAA family protein [Flavobacterium foetidum]|uniref:STAS/SEC14 domain-containing protein n=1 Tax=Flavobacterium foetidum TaxID=2026681 RepID=UPI001074A7EE|nr:STAS/SEC14 domain-containing protein [Flavobacterium foetidum]KAF2517151.1 STAS/SEC14 domain-containing protein [Flavobacterium foetidum]